MLGLRRGHRDGLVKSGMESVTGESHRAVEQAEHGGDGLGLERVLPKESARSGLPFLLLTSSRVTSDGEHVGSSGSTLYRQTPIGNSQAPFTSPSRSQPNSPSKQRSSREVLGAAGKLSPQIRSFELGPAVLGSVPPAGDHSLHRQSYEHECNCTDKNRKPRGH